MLPGRDIIIDLRAVWFDIVADWITEIVPLRYLLKRKGLCKCKHKHGMERN